MEYVECSRSCCSHFKFLVCNQILIFATLFDLVISVTELMVTSAENVHELSHILQHFLQGNASLLSAEVTMWIQRNLTVKSADDIVQLTSLISILPSRSIPDVLSMVLGAEDSIKPEWKVPIILMKLSSIF